MKLKEYPISAVTAWKLSRQDITKLTAHAVDRCPVIVSLTSIPSRLRTLHLTIRSLLAQTVKPEKIVLWLNDALKERIPQPLRDLQGDLFEIRYSNLTCSHRKLIHALRDFPERTIVTCDDDVMYAPGWLERLYTDHAMYPRDIIAHECRVITRNETGELKPYQHWKTVTTTGVSGSKLLPIGYAGILYPPNALMEDACDVNLFMRLAPKADDLWFKAMSHLKGTNVRRCSTPEAKPVPIIGSQKVSLLKSNVREDYNRYQWESICSHYEFVL